MIGPASLVRSRVVEQSRQSKVLTARCGAFGAIDLEGEFSALPAPHSLGPHFSGLCLATPGATPVADSLAGISRGPLSRTENSRRCRRRVAGPARAPLLPYRLISVEDGVEREVRALAISFEERI